MNLYNTNELNRKQSVDLNTVRLVNKTKNVLRYKHEKVGPRNSHTVILTSLVTARSFSTMSANTVGTFNRVMYG